MFDLTGKTALITGATGGIGVGIAKALHGAGATIAISGTRAAVLEELKTALGARVHVLPCNLSDAADVEKLVPAAETAMGGIDILVNNAGIQRVSPIEEFDPADFRRIISLMLEAPFLLIRAALPGMYERGFGRIINVSSVHGIRASAFKSAYVSAKHGLEGLSKVTALEGGAHGVTSNCVAPGYVRTPLVEKQLVDQAAVHGIPESEVLSRIMLTESAIKRLVEPEEVASLIAWLASREAAMVTGASYTMDGGWSAR